MRVNQCAGPGCRIPGVAEGEMDQVLIRDDDEYKRNTAWVLSRCAMCSPHDQSAY